MRYEVHNRKNIDRLTDDNLLVELLTMRGVGNAYELLNLNPSVLKDGWKFRNMEEAIELLDLHLLHNDHIHIIMDSDVDGLTSASAMYGYITRASDCVVTYDTHTKKQHGLYREIVERIPTDTKLVIIPDAGSDTKSEEWIKMLVNSGYNVLVLDHHEIEGLKDCEGIYRNENVGVIVNNQDGYYENDTLSGVGVVFKFLQVMDSAIPRDNVEAMDFLGLVSLGLN